MTHYVLGLYRRVPGRPTIPDEEADRIQEAHLAKLRGLKETGAMIVSGPLEEDSDLRGVLIFNTGSVEEARQLIRDDPAVTGGRLTVDLYTWFAPVGLRVVPAAHDPTELDFTSD
jgi:uncharacterized protein YciI